MKKIILFIATLLSLNAFSQNVKIEGSFDRQDIKRKLTLSRPMNRTQFPELNETEEIAIDKGIFSISLSVLQPEIMYLTSHVNDSIEFNQALFLKDGYAITINFKTKSGMPQLTISGKGAQDNQPWTGLSNNINFSDYPKDTIPDRISADLQKQANENLDSFQRYIAMYKPSADFIRNWNVEMQYIPIRTYYIYAKQRILYVRQAYYRNIKSWNDKFEQMLVKAPLMNRAALSSSGYRFFIKTFLFFSNPMAMPSEVAEEEFVKTMYEDGRDTGTRSFLNDKLNIPNQKVIEKYFTGKVKEYMYATLFKMALERGVVTNIDSIYTDFSKQYPFSIYKKLYGDQVAAVMQSVKQPINDKMIFEPAGIKTWAEVLNLFKGKTVLLDMWGTWCGPCREEIKNAGPVIKTYFKDKGLDYLYIANDDEAYVKTWKSLIAYFNMEGHHILASKDLTNNIERTLQPTGAFLYPTYVIIHKDGTFELSKASLSTVADRKIVIAQIEEALK
jgi:thiol-disulfide isomerase/thioredoxin